MQFLDWFVKEQGEEETNANDLITKMELLVQTQKVFICLTKNLRHEFILRRRWFYKCLSKPTLGTQRDGSLVFCSTTSVKLKNMITCPRKD